MQQIGILEKQSFDLTTKKLQLEKNITAEYIKRQQIMNRMDSRGTGLSTIPAQALDYARLANNTRNIGQNAGALSTMLGTLGGDIFGAEVIGDKLKDLYRIETMPGGGGSYTIGAGKIGPRKGIIRQLLSTSIMRSVGTKIMGVVGVGSLASSALKSADDIMRGSQNMGMTPSQYQQYSFAAKQSGMGDIGSIYEQFVGARNQALGGNAAMQGAFQNLGVKNLSNAQEAFQQLLGNMGGMGKPNQGQLKSATDIFGEGGGQQIFEGLKNGFNKFKETTSIMSDTVVKDLQYVGNTLTVTLKEITNAFGWVLVALSPILYAINLIKSVPAGIGATLGALSAGEGIKGSLRAGIDANLAYMEAFESPKGGSGAASFGPGNLASQNIGQGAGVSLNKMQKMGFYLGGGQTVTQENKLQSTLQKIAGATAGTEANTAATAAAITGKDPGQSTSWNTGWTGAN